MLLVEVMRADGHFGAAEQAAVRAALVEKFELAPDEAERLVELATSTAQEATDLFGFTTRLNERFTDAQKLRMVELMWAVAYADGQLADHERHLMWRVADLLHVPQGAYVLARQRAAAGGVPKQRLLAGAARVAATGLPAHQSGCPQAVRSIKTGLPGSLLLPVPETGRLQRFGANPGVSAGRT